MKLSYELDKYEDLWYYEFSELCIKGEIKNKYKQLREKMEIFLCPEKVISLLLSFKQDPKKNMSIMSSSKQDLEESTKNQLKEKLKLGSYKFPIESAPFLIFLLNENISTIKKLKKVAIDDFEELILGSNLSVADKKDYLQSIISDSQETSKSDVDFQLNTGIELIKNLTEYNSIMCIAEYKLKITEFKKIKKICKSKENKKFTRPGPICIDEIPNEILSLIFVELATRVQYVLSSERENFKQCLEDIEIMWDGSISDNSSDVNYEMENSDIMQICLSENFRLIRQKISEQIQDKKEKI